MVDIEQIDAELEKQEKRVYVPPQPPISKAVPSPTLPDQGFGQLREAITLLAELEKWRQTVVGTELMKIQAMEKQVDARVQAAVQMQQATAGSIEDDIMREGAKEFFSAFREAKAAGAFTSQIKADQQQPATTQAKPQNAQPAPSNAAPTEQDEVSKMKLTQARAQYYADQIFEHFPQQVLAAQRGEMSKEEAIKKIMQSGASQENAEMIYKELMSTDYSSPDGAV